MRKSVTLCAGMRSTDQLGQMFACLWSFWRAVSVTRCECNDLMTSASCVDHYAVQLTVENRVKSVISMGFCDGVLLGFQNFWYLNRTHFRKWFFFKPPARSWEVSCELASIGQGMANSLRIFESRFIHSVVCLTTGS